jgi:hypothetical protein
MVGAGLAVPVMIKISGWKHTGASLTGSMVVGIASAAIWVQVGFSTYLNEAAIGMLFSFGANWLLLMALPTFTTSPDANQTAARDQFEDA